MKKYLTLMVILPVILLTMGNLTQAQCEDNSTFTISPADSGINFFEGTWSELLAEAKKQNKVIFVNGHIIKCQPCTNMLTRVYTDAEVGAYYNQHFISYNLDFKQGEGPEIAKQYEIKNYPTLLFVNASGTEVYRFAGELNKSYFLGLGQAALDLAPEKSNIRNLLNK